MNVRVGLWRRLSAEELMPLNCGVGEDSWESPGLQDQTEYSLEGLMLKLKLQYFGHLMRRTDLLKRLFYWERLKAREKGTTGDEMVGWHHRLDGHEFERALGVGDGQGGLECCSLWGCKVRCDWATELNWKVMVAWTKKVLPAILVNKGCCLLFWYTSDASSQAISHCSHPSVCLEGHSRWRKQDPGPTQLTCTSKE